MAQDGHEVIFRPWTTTRGGKVIWARDYGLKAFAIRVNPKDRKKPKKKR
jgi:hypothetical protein